MEISVRTLTSTTADLNQSKRIKLNIVLSNKNKLRVNCELNLNTGISN